LYLAVVKKISMLYPSVFLFHSVALHDSFLQWIQRVSESIRSVGMFFALLESGYCEIVALLVALFKRCQSTTDALAARQRFLVLVLDDVVG
jgi:hypothetical protein